MKVSTNGNVVSVVLSQRNLDTMVKASQLGLNNGLLRVQDDGICLAISVESNEKHYEGASEERKAGSKEVQRLLAQEHPSDQL